MQLASSQDLHRAAAAALALTLSAGAEPPLPAAEETVTRNTPSALEFEQPVVRVPFTLIHGKIIVEATIGGAGPFPFVYDTGAGGIVLHESLVRDLELPVIGTTRIGDPTDPDAIETDVVDIDRIGFPGLDVVDLTANAWSGTWMFRGEDAPRGVLSFPMFHDCLLTIDYAAAELVLQRGVLADSAAALPMTLDMAIPEIALRVGDRAVVAHLDTGAPGGVALPSTFAEELEFVSDPVVVGHARTVNSTFEIRAATLADPVRVGEWEIESPAVELNDLFSTAVIGYRFLAQFRTTFDQVNERVLFERASSDPLVLSMPNRRRGH